MVERRTEYMEQRDKMVMQYIRNMIDPVEKAVLLDLYFEHVTLEAETINDLLKIEQV